MAQEDLEFVSRWTQAFNERDLPALIDLTSPDFEFTPYFAATIEATVYRGHDGLRRYFADAAGVWNEIAIRIDGIDEVGRVLVARGELHGRGKGSGVDARVAVAWVVEIVDGKLTRAHTFATEAEALEAAGSESA